MKSAKLRSQQYWTQIDEEKNVRSSKLLTLLAVGLALGISGCAAVGAARSAEVEKQKSFEHRVDTAHIWVTMQAAPAGKLSPRKVS
jgi:hypothetical protein